MPPAMNAPTVCRIRVAFGCSILVLRARKRRPRPGRWRGSAHRVDRRSCRPRVRDGSCDVWMLVHRFLRAGQVSTVPGDVSAAQGRGGYRKRRMSDETLLIGHALGPRTDAGPGPRTYFGPTSSDLLLL